MAKAKKKNSPSPWSKADMTLLRRAAGRESTREIARKLKRSEGAVRFKAHMEGVSLRRR